MIIVEMQFPAGRYHATPWGRNVNEGEAEWPPSPYRLIRALIDVWKRRRPDWPRERVEPVLEALSVPPVYHLPPTTTAHTRSYLSSNQRDREKKQLIFDAFVVLSKDEKVRIGFDQELSPESMEDLDELLSEMNYLGRSESWIRLGLLTGQPEMPWNCRLATDVTAPGEQVDVACPSTPEAYGQTPIPPLKKKTKGAVSEIMTWLEAMTLNTDELLKAGWSRPPALRWETYIRPMRVQQLEPPKSSLRLHGRFRCAKYALLSAVPPQVEETAPFAERIRRKLMGIHRRVQDGDPGRISSRFSGKDQEGAPLKGHRHAFFLPLDEDGDGRLDHLLIQAADPFDATELRALDLLSSIWQTDGRPDVKLALVSLSAELPSRQSRWVSASPFTTARHYRKGRGQFDEWLSDEIRKECAYHGLPEPVRILWISHAPSPSRPVRWMAFTRSRKDVTPNPGFGCALEFPNPVEGPFALGVGAHFGLGLFLPAGEAART